MASLIKRNTKYSIRFTGIDGLRKTLAAGTTSERQALRVLERVELLLKAARTGDELDAQTAIWLSEAPTKLRERMANVGLIVVERADEANVATLGAYIDRYIAARTDVKEITRTKWRQTRGSLVSFFGGDRPLGKVTAGDAKDFERWLKQSRKARYLDAEKADVLAGDTIRKRISHAKQFFADAVARKLIEANPFAGLKSKVGANRSRDRFITRDEAAKVLDECPSNEWRLLFALSRFGGLRCPSEHLALNWGDIDWAASRMRVTSPKTEHHEGHGSRVVPIFPELRPYLEAAFEAAEPGSEYVVAGYRRAATNLRTQLERIIKLAGLEPWPKLWANLRASRATELATEHPAHVAAAWLGHSTSVAQKHYWQVTEADFTKATGGTIDETVADRGEKNVATFVTTARRREPQETVDAGTTTAIRRSTAHLIAGEMNSVPPSGLEPETR